MITLKDQINNTVSLSAPAVRIVCLVPSLTELLSDLGLDHEVKGITKFCVHPESWRNEKTIVGGTKQFHPAKIAELKPDLIIANKEENSQELIQDIAESFPVYVSQIKTLGDCFEFIKHLALLTDKKESAVQMLAKFKKEFNGLPVALTNGTVAYCIWKEPWMFAGKDTFINHMLEQAGFSNVVDKERYPSYTLEEIQSLNPSFIFLSSEPFPFKEKHIKSLSKQFPETAIILVDGEMFSWYGSRMLQFPAYIKSLLSEIKTS